jgi:hypothetical protein
MEQFSINNIPVFCSNQQCQKDEEMTFEKPWNSRRIILIFFKSPDFIEGSILYSSPSISILIILECVWESSVIFRIVSKKTSTKSFSTKYSKPVK